MKRNRLAASKAEELVYVHSNLRLLTHSQNEYKEGGIKFWDVDLEQTDLNFSAAAQSLLDVQSGSHHPPSASSSVVACDSNLLASSNVIVTDDVDVDALI